MIFGIISGVIIIGLAVGAFILAYHQVDNDGKGTVPSIIVGIAFVIAFLCVPFSFHTVDTGEVAVVKQLGKAKEVKTAGTYYDFWMTNKYMIYDGKVQNIEIQTSAYSSDAQTMDLAVTMQYKILTDKSMEIATQYGSLEALTTRINAIATEKTKAVLSEQKAMDIIANRQNISPKVEEAIRSAVDEEYYVNIVSVVLTNIDFSDAFEQAVEDKMIAEQQQLKADYENKTKVAKAEADAKAKLVEAEATAKANDLLRQTLTKETLYKEYLEKWDGKLPTYVGGDNATMIMPSVETAK